MVFLLSDHIKDFLSYCRQKGHSQNTIAAYRNSLEKFMAYAHAQQVTRAEGVTRPLLRGYAEMVSEAMSPGGAHARLRPLKTFFNWLEADEVIDKSPMRRIPLPKLPRKILPAISPQEVQALLGVARQSRHPLRDSALVGVLYDTGLRVSELCGLALTDIQPGGRLEVREAKGGRSRIVPISRTALKLISRYVSQERPATSMLHLFLLDAETPVNRDSVKQLLGRLCKSADIASYSPHAFRRGFAVNFLRNSGDVFTLQRILGHSSLEMTNRYAVLQVDDLKNVHIRASPLTHSKRGERGI
ncbi:tyrosine-type recombinase/integrase [uncultured Deinococcus sp.]|uniref:tyrosine-type recombinase/integrase n=1 Tax=uncultured Deinococcus sp. TaxID=158789 RepID=UPI00338E8015